VKEGTRTLIKSFPKLRGDKET